MSIATSPGLARLEIASARGTRRISRRERGGNGDRVAGDARSAGDGRTGERSDQLAAGPERGAVEPVVFESWAHARGRLAARDPRGRSVCGRAWVEAGRCVVGDSQRVHGAAASRWNRTSSIRAEKRPTLGDAYRVEVRVGALFQRGGTWNIFTVENGRARLREVRVRRSDGTLTQILEGVKPDADVIVYPGDGITNGVRVAFGK